MAHIKSAKKSIRIIRERRTRNRSMTSALKTCIGKADKLIQGKELEPAQAAVKQATIALDRAAQKGLIHSNKAARSKSRLVKRLNAAPVSKG